MHSKVTTCVLTGVVALVVGAMALAQTSSGSPDTEPQRGGGAGIGDPNKIFDMLSRGRGYFLAEDMRQLREPMTQWLQTHGITDGKVTRELFMAFQDEARSNPAGTAALLGSSSFGGSQGGGFPG